MILYKCNICKNIFDESEKVEIHKSGTYENDYGVASLFDNLTQYDNVESACPFCRNTDFVKGYVCRECGKFVKSTYDDIRCDDCFSKGDKK